MKQFKLYFIGFALALALLGVAAFFAIVGILPIKGWITDDPSFAPYLYMVPVALTLFALTGLSLMAAILSGMYTTYLYGKGKVFELPMEKGLNRTGLAFLSACLFSLLFAIYLAVNFRSFSLFAALLLFVGLFLLAAFLFFLLADVVEKGRKLQDEHDLTI